MDALYERLDDEAEEENSDVIPLLHSFGGAKQLSARGEVWLCALQCVNKLGCGGSVKENKAEKSRAWNRVKRILCIDSKLHLVGVQALLLKHVAKALDEEFRARFEGQREFLWQQESSGFRGGRI